MFYDRLLKKVTEEGRGEPSLERMATQLTSAKVFLIDTEQAEVFLESGYPLSEYPHFAFDNIFINFTRPLVIDVPESGGGDRSPIVYQGFHMRCEEVRELDACDITKVGRGLYASTWDGSSSPLKGCTVTWWESFPRQGYSPGNWHWLSFTPSSFPQVVNSEIVAREGDLETTQILHRLGVSFAYFLACENVEVQEHRPKRRRRKRSTRKQSGPPRLYYTVSFKRSSARELELQGSGGRGGVGFRHDVRGHFRHLRDDRYARNEDGTHKVVWVRPHQRGLEHELYIPGCRRVRAERGSATELRVAARPRVESLG